MNRAWLAFGVLLLAAVPSGCFKDEALAPGDISGTYQYLAYAGDGTLVVRGTLTIRQQGSVAVDGTWSLRATGADGQVGPQVGNGRLEGTAEEQSDGRVDLNVELNPNVADNSITLRGTFDGLHIRGQWSWTTLAGVANGGVFDARRQSGF